LDFADSLQDRLSSLRGACRAHNPVFFLLRWIVSESSLGLLLLIVFITVNGSGVRGKVFSYSRLQTSASAANRAKAWTQRRLRRMALGGEGSRTNNVRAKSESYIPQLHFHHKLNITAYRC
jgi:hypothetical protein